MKRLFFLLYCCLFPFLMPLTALAAPEWPSNVSIEADGGILMDADTGTVLYGKNMDQSYYPASITKILTALIVLENCSLDEMVEFSHDDVYNVEAGSSSAGIDEGDILTVRDCLYALMLASANESANALACHVSGSREAFAELMNQKAASLGCTGSHFANPSGLNDENHYTTAHDMALITREAIKNPAFLEINNTRSYQLAPTKRSPEGGYVANHHRMLNKNEAVYYPGAFAGKTGYTSLAGNTLVTCAQKNGMTLIAVVLNGHQSHYTDTKALFDFGFGNFQSLKAADFETAYRSIENDMTIGGMMAQDSISLKLDSEGRITIPKDADFTDTASSLSYDLDGSEPQDAVAVIRYTYEGRPVGTVYLRCPSLSALPETAISVPFAEASDSVAAENPPEEEAAGSLPDSSGQQEAEPSAALMSSDGSSAPEARESRRDIISREGTATGIRIPANLLTIMGIGLSLALIIAVIIIVRIHVRKKEEADLLARRQRRLERLEDIGFSSSDFDRLVAKRRSSSAASLSSRRRGRKRNGKNSLFR
ncbi:D-alanyl-D-alanine carboxypeptidase family protein [Lacrimispora sp. 210928-DFI.3.58]|uniref:D-alanyl-D-alanine carboxypeptidase family protein n=1 Tax=Lacrimispora sp. 210928-DFI.3.58 TaxID=2883214 RepID=UPI001D080859|nr:D-alanyl-D-alanine carboxypeptidase family protein [Lacrimispora sp. 210928-DFI.3.58]MCB7321280.1 D-alanyl-D-alanine carboxypeptidase [Lacrimispora sp. 210928-DFI.3.58]